MQTRWKSRVVVVVAFVCFSACAIAGTHPQITSATSETGTVGNPYFYQTTVAGEQFAALDPTKTYLLNSATNQPQFCAGDDAWDLAVQLSNADVNTYLADRASRGINCIWVALADNTYQTNAPQDYYGNSPFDGADFTNEDSTYWAHVDFVLGRIQAYGLTAFISPAFVGDNASSGYYTSYQNSSAATLTAYGAWLATRYRSYPNIVWTLGGDTLPAFFQQVADIATGIRSVDSVHLITMEGTPEADSSQTQSSSAYAYCTPTCPSWLNVNWIYNQYQSVQFGCAYNTATWSLPNLMGESWYEGEHNMTELQVREEGYWGTLSGCPLGNLFGNDAIWTFGGPYETMRATWQSQMSSAGSVAQAWEGALFRSREFWKLLPDATNTWLTSGYGSGTTISVLSRTSDGQTMIAYIPNGNATSVTINMAGITSSSDTVQGWWFSPQTGATTNLGTFSNSGSQNFSPPDSNDWLLVLDDASAGLAAPGSTPLTTIASPITFGATGLPAGLSINPATGLISGTPTVAGAFSVALTATNSFGTGNDTLTLTVGKATPVITWATPAPVSYGTALGATQLNATANVPGTFTYSPAAGMTPGAGSHTITATFTPNDTTDYYKTTTAVITLTVNAVMLRVTANNASRVYGAANPVFTDTITGFVLGQTKSVLSGAASLSTTATASSPLGTYPITGAPGTLSAANYTFTFVDGTLTINQAQPTINWATPAPITYGTALGASQLDATSNVPGTFVYSPAAGATPKAGTRTLWETFTPTDTTDYKTVATSVTLTVNQATPSITWANPAAITYGAALGRTQLDASSTVAGIFSYSPGSGTVLTAGQQPLVVTLTPTDPTDYTTAKATATLTVNQAKPSITWGAPSAITYGTALSSTQLDASANVPGTFAYSPTAGTVLTAGTHSLSVTFTPTDNVDYSTATPAVSLTVNQATPSITWANPAAITYGTALSHTQLDASSKVAGTFTYSPASGAVLTSGAQTLSTTLAPTDTVDYRTAKATVPLTINQAKPILTWPTPAPISSGTALSAAQLDATANVAGSFVYSPPAGATPKAGTHTLWTTFTPTDTADYKTVATSVTLTVN